MGIQKQEFYEGAALHRLVRTGGVNVLLYDAPLFVLNERVQAFLKYSTAGRSPWSFTFTPEEQRMLNSRAAALPIVVGLICGADSIAAVPFSSLLAIAPIQGSSIRISCIRRHREHFEVRGPEGALHHKIPPSDWEHISAAY